MTTSTRMSPHRSEPTAAEVFGPAANKAIIHDTVTLMYPIHVSLDHMDAWIKGVSPQGNIHWELPPHYFGCEHKIQGTRNMLHVLRGYNQKTQYDSRVDVSKINFDRIYIRTPRMVQPTQVHDDGTDITTSSNSNNNKSSDSNVIGIPLLLFCQHATLYRDRAVVPTTILRPMIPRGFTTTLFPTRIAVTYNSHPTTPHHQRRDGDDDDGSDASESGDEYHSEIDTTTDGDEYDWLLNVTTSIDRNRGRRRRHERSIMQHNIRPCGHAQDEYSDSHANDDMDQDDDMDGHEIDYPDTPSDSDESDSDVLTHRYAHTIVDTDDDDDNNSMWSGRLIDTRGDDSDSCRCTQHGRRRRGHGGYQRTTCHRYQHSHQKQHRHTRRNTTIYSYGTDNMMDEDNDDLLWIPRGDTACNVGQDALCSGSPLGMTRIPHNNDVATRALNAERLPVRPHVTRPPRIISKRSMEYQRTHCHDISWSQPQGVQADSKHSVVESGLQCRMCFHTGTETLCYPNGKIAYVGHVPVDRVEQLCSHMIANDHNTDACLVLQLSEEDQRHMMCVRCLRQMFVLQRDMAQTILNRSLSYDAIQHTMVVECPVGCATHCNGALPTSIITTWLLWTEDERERFASWYWNAKNMRSLTPSLGAIATPHRSTATEAEATRTVSLCDTLRLSPTHVDSSSSVALSSQTHENSQHGSISNPTLLCSDTTPCPYFYRPLHLRQHAHDYALTASELTLDLCYEQILDQIVAGTTIDFSHVTVTCPVCLQHLSKSIACNAMSHCQVEVCNVCGEFTHAAGTGTSSHRSTLPLKHWDDKGLRGCPRWDSDLFWHKRCHINLQCTAERCGDDGEHECRDPVHVESKKKMNSNRLFNMIYHKLRWLRQHECSTIADHVETRLLTESNAGCSSSSSSGSTMDVYKLYIVAEAAHAARLMVQDGTSSLSVLSNPVVDHAINNSSL